MRIKVDEFRARASRAAKAATETGYDGLLIAGRSTPDGTKNIRWLTGHVNPSLVTTPTGPWTSVGQDYLVIDGNAKTTLVSSGVSEVPVADEVHIGADPHALLCRAIEAHQVAEGTLGLAGSEVLTWATAEQLRESFPRLRLQPADVLLARVRMSLSPAECEMLRRAANIGGAILKASLAAAIPGATDGDVVAAGYREACRHAHTHQWSFVLASGVQSYRYMANASPPWDNETRYEKGALVHPDCFGSVDGYVYDIQRTVVVGAEPTPPQQWLLDGAWEHVQQLGNALYDGITPRDVHARGLAIMSDLGHEPPADPKSWFRAFSHFGHGFATGFDWPWLAESVPDADHPLRAPFAVTIEIPWEDPAVGSAYVEDEFLVLADRVEWLTAAVSKTAT
jgi:Xaa-Pro aminopeptidase